MALRIDMEQTERELFCCSKWWGAPDMPADMEYPMMDTPEGRYPLTFLCQVDCEDIAKLAPEAPLPKEGMLYFFALADEFLGYESPVQLGKGEWPKGTVMVKYTKEINFETFCSCMMVDDSGEELTDRAMLLTLGECPDDFGGLRLLGDSRPGRVSLLQVAFDPEHTLVIDIRVSDLGYGNWKRAGGFML